MRCSPKEWFKKSSKIRGFVAVSNFVKDIYIKAGINSDKIKVIYNPVTLPSLKPDRSAKEQYVLFIGRLTKAKGTDLLYELIVNNPDILFKIAGEGPEKEKFERLTDSGTKNCQLLGYISGESKYSIIKNSKLVIVPSQWWETFGLTVIEANALGKKVLASNIGGVSELVIDGFNGILCEPNNFEQFNKALRRLYFERNDNSVSEDIIKYSKKFSLESYINQLLQYYRKIIKL